jgi:hypothetical protein
MNRRKLVAYAAMITLALAAVSNPIARRMAMTATIEFVRVAEKIVKFPCWLVNHPRSLSLDRLDPTCPQCM